MALLRELDLPLDRKAIRRIWREVGWIGEDKEEDEAMDLFVGSAQAMVAELDQSPECLVLSHPGSLRYLDQPLPLCAVTGVLTSRVARKQGLARRLTARLVAHSAARGAQVAALGIFEQGFYNLLGFGCAAYEHLVTFDPARLRHLGGFRAPQRIAPEDWERVHASRLARRQSHGNITLWPAEVTRAEMMWTKKGFGLGYTDGPSGELTHHFWCSNEGGEHGPYSVYWLSYQTRRQFLELMALLKSLGDQVHAVRMVEPPGVQLQDLIEQPFKQRRLSDKSEFAAGTRAAAWYQMRICDLQGCVAQMVTCGERLRFNLRLSDPIGEYLEADSPWRGVAGDYVVALGERSFAEPGHDAALPDLTASVNAFTRLWLGVRPASGLAFTDDLDGPDELLAQLDRALRLPAPKVFWDF
ncbi:MAG: GNAT family N-acetyltransferase [Anaerolineae bacterium]|nr:GNAT family N-acetyltransferase [Anaerolineae bacterium]